MPNDRAFIREALTEARRGLKEGGIPIGAVLVKDDRIIGRGHNMRVQENDPLAHAEICCIRNAGRIGNYGETTLYSTLMPCYLCAGAVIQFGIPRVVVGESSNFHGAGDLLSSMGVEVMDLDLTEIKDMMARFIERRPDLWNEDIGEI